MRAKNIFIMLLVFGLGLFFRFYLITQMPGGVFPDEAAEGLDAQNILHGLIQPFYERGNGREGLFYYLLAPAIKLLGNGYWQLHLVSAFISFLSLLGTYLLAKRLFDRNTALIATFLMAVNTWDIVLSRTAFRAILIPFFISFGFYFLIGVFQEKSVNKKWWNAFFAGIFLGGGFYSYIAYRIVVGIIAIIAALLLFADAKQHFNWTKAYWKYALIALIAFILVCLPLAKYFVAHPGSFAGRSGQVSIFNPELNHGNLLGTFREVFLRSLGAYFKNGDLNWRHNISGLPLLPPLVSPFFGASLAVLTLLALKFVWQSLFSRPNTGQLKYLLLIGLFWGMLVPAVTTAEGIPHGLRSIGTIPVVFILCALAIKYFAQAVNFVWRYPWMNKIYIFVAIVYFGSIALTAYLQYFVISYNSQENFYAFRSDLSAVSGYLNNNPEKFRNFLVLDMFSEQSTQYLTNQYNQPYVVVDPANAFKLRLKSTDRVIFTASTLYDYKKFNASRKNKIIYQAHNKFNSLDLIVAQPLTDDYRPSLAVNADQSFWALNLGDRVYWYWLNQSFNPWKISIYQCESRTCAKPREIKINNQNDYLQNSDWMAVDGTKADLFYKATALDQSGRLLKDFGVIALPRY